MVNLSFSVGHRVYFTDDGFGSEQQTLLIFGASAKNSPLSLLKRLRRHTAVSVVQLHDGKLSSDFPEQRQAA